MNKLWLWVLLIFLIELLVILVVFPKNWADKTIEHESVLMQTRFGTEASRWIQRTASGWFAVITQHSGIKADLQQFLLPSPGEHKALDGLAYWLNARIAALMDIIFAICLRLALLLLLLPYLAVACSLVVLQGFITRAIKRTNCDYVSPVIHTYAMRLIGYLGIGLLLILCSPLEIEPELLPVLFVGLCVLLMKSMTHVQKRV